MSRVIALCFLLLAAVIGFLHIDSRPAWAPFSGNEVIAQEADETNQAQPESKVTAKTKVPSQPSIASPRTDWLPDTGAPSVHAASLIALKDGAVRAFWFAGSREGAPDVVINTAVFDPKTNAWAAPTVVIDRVGAEKGLSRYIAKLGNPVPARLPDGRLQLFFVTVSIGGWAGSSISTMLSDDDGLTWGRPQRLITSPFVNLSTLVKSPAVQMTDGRLGLPAYHEWIGRFGEFLRLDITQVIDKRRMSSGRSAIQPAVFVNEAQDATAYFRQTRSAGQAKRIPVSLTRNAGQSWQSATDLEIENPNSAVAGLTLKNGAHLLVLNNIEAGRYRLVFMMSNPKSGQWQVIEVLENDEALPDQERKEFSYPYLISASGSDAHLVYTWDRKKIRHLYFSSAWLDRAYSQLPVQSNAGSSIEVKEAQ
ncbi:sialidase family protein [Polynucleobacter sp. AP-Sanab-80-C2]|uniref:sialidase family protein n=1 Tax=Polynucleobacter sp. AP-Sanab-80-C2 TaxID=3108274 RepID=UPI002B231124|nr:sialidase family protein [Polynucleobacter sp. AP-Sanab-80-C2]MEA9599019.1 sialidase family protein [Polynucleobacter sp. AP-Sanab-80-C2]